MKIKSSYWFGATLLSGLLFLWCIVSVLESDGVDAAWIWGLIVFGVIALVAGLMAVITFFAQGGRLDKRDMLLDAEASAPPRHGHRATLRGSDNILTGNGEVPRPSSGRSLLH